MEKSWGYYSIDKILIKCEIWSLKVPQCFVGLWCFPIDLAIGVCISQGPLLRAFVTLLKATTTSKLLCSGTCTIPKLYFTNSQHQDHWSGLKRPNSFGIKNLKQLKGTATHLFKNLYRGPQRRCLFTYVSRQSKHCRSAMLDPNCRTFCCASGSLLPVYQNFASIPPTINRVTHQRIGWREFQMNPTTPGSHQKKFD